MTPTRSEPALAHPHARILRSVSRHATLSCGARRLFLGHVNAQPFREGRGACGLSGWRGEQSPLRAGDRCPWPAPQRWVERAAVGQVRDRRAIARASTLARPPSCPACPLVSFTRPSRIADRRAVRATRAATCPPSPAPPAPVPIAPSGRRDGLAAPRTARSRRPVPLGVAHRAGGSARPRGPALGQDHVGASKPWLRARWRR